MPDPIDIKTRRPIGGEPPQPTYPPAYYDVAAVRLAIMRLCPVAARGLLDHDAITGIAQAAIQTLDRTRRARVYDSTADQRSDAHEWVPGLVAAYGWGQDLPPIETPPDTAAEFRALQDFMRPRNLTPGAVDPPRSPDESA